MVSFQNVAVKKTNMSLKEQQSSIHSFRIQQRSYELCQPLKIKINRERNQYLSTGIWGSILQGPGWQGVKCLHHESSRDQPGQQTTNPVLLHVLSVAGDSHHMVHEIQLHFLQSHYGLISFYLCRYWALASGYIFFLRLLLTSTSTFQSMKSAKWIKKMRN